MSIETKMDYLVETKNEIKQAIRDQGVDVSDALPFRQYAEKVGNIVTSIDGIGVHEFKRGEQMLQNAYWVNRAGIINQRNNTSYTSTSSDVYGIDRWYVLADNSSAVSSMTLTDAGLFYSVNNGGIDSLCAFGQRFTISDLGLKAGDTVTFSLLYSTEEKFSENGGQTESVRIFLTNMENGDDYKDYIVSTVMNTSDNNIHMATVTMTLPSWTTGNSILANYIGSHSDIVRHHLYAAKLEKGSVQTLAHQENGVWVLNDPAPDPALELLKCQRYFLKLTGISKIRAAQYEPMSKMIWIMIPTPVMMRSTPIITSIGASEIYLFHSTGPISIDSYGIEGYSGNGIVVWVTSNVLSDSFDGFFLGNGLEFSADI